MEECEIGIDNKSRFRLSPCLRVSVAVFRRFTRRGFILRRLAALPALLILFTSASLAAEKPAWCKNLPRPEYKALEKAASADPWFEVYRIKPGVYAIYEPRQSEEVISYLITGSKKALLFDTGLGIGNIRKVTDALTQLPVSVVNSHTHNDHVGDNWRFDDIYGMDTDFTRTSARGSTEDAQAELAPGQLCGDLPPGFDAKSYSTRPFKITHWLHGGDKIDLGNRVLEVVATPGHTPDSIALFDEKNGLLLIGDTFYLGPVFLYRPETDLAAYILSLKKLSVYAARAQTVLPAHNTPVIQPGYIPRAAISIQDVLHNRAQGRPRYGKIEYEFKGYSFLLKEAPPEPQLK